jgi:hypothetical protein
MRVPWMLSTCVICAHACCVSMHPPTVDHDSHCCTCRILRYRTYLFLVEIRNEHHVMETSVHAYKHRMYYVGDTQDLGIQGLQSTQCMHACVDVDVCVSGCVRIRMFKLLSRKTFMRTRSQTGVNAYRNTCTHNIQTCMRAFIHIHTYIHTCMDSVYIHARIPKQGVIYMSTQRNA